MRLFVVALQAPFLNCLRLIFLDEYTEKMKLLCRNNYVFMS